MFNSSLKGLVSTQDTLRTNFQRKGDLFAPEGQRTGITDKGRNRGGRRREKEQECRGRTFAPETKPLPLDRKDSVARRQMDPGVRVTGLFLLGMLIRVTKRELLIAEHQYFDSLTLMVSLRGIH